MNVKTFASLALALALTGTAASAQLAADPPSPPAREPTRAAAYFHEVVWPLTWAEPLGYTVWDHAREEPDSWGADTDGMLKRLASHTGRTAISFSVRHGVAAILGEPADPVRCASAVGGARLVGAALEPIADRGCNGAVRVAIPRITARLASSFAPMAWNEPEYSAADGALSFATGVVTLAAFRVGRVLLFKN